MLDALLAAEELPEEYRDRCQVHSIISSLFGVLGTGLRELCGIIILTRLCDYNIAQKKNHEFFLPPNTPTRKNKESSLLTPST